jgi:hypothetical protein
MMPAKPAAVDEAASMNVLVLRVDNMGTSTTSKLTGAAMAPVNQHGEAGVPLWARLANADGGLDPVRGRA